jgi:hypothetical protein
MASHTLSESRLQLTNMGESYTAGEAASQPGLPLISLLY